MANPDYIGVNGVARKVTGYFYGVGGVARKVREMYYGDRGNIARLVYSATEAVDIPTQKNTLTYNKASQVPTWNNYDPERLTIGGTTSAVNAGSYTATFTPKEGYTWSDGGTDTRNATWSIGKAQPETPVLSRTSISLSTASPTATFTVTRDGDGVITAVSGNTATATASVSGTTVTVTGKNSGAAVITVTVAEGTNYLAYTGSAARCTVSMAEVAVDYLCFTAESITLSVGDKKKHWDGTIEYSTDKVNWSVWSGTKTLTASGTLYMRGTGNTVITGARDSTRRWNFGTTGYHVSASGNIMTLLDYETVAAGGFPQMGTSCFAELFYGNTLLKSAPTLPATTLTGGCYADMFYQCTLLTAAPTLPATYVPEHAYYEMFYGCKALTAAPVMRASNVETYGCAYMFKSCTALTRLPQNRMMLIRESGCREMFSNCTALVVSATSGTNYTYAFRIPYSGTGEAGTDALYNMFYQTSGPFTGTPAVNTTYYTANPLVQ